MTGFFLVGSFSISITENKWVIIEFIQKLPSTTNGEITYTQHILMQLEQAKEFYNKLNESFDEFEKVMKQPKNPKRKDKENYIG